MNSKSKISYPIISVVAAAIAAYRFNDNKIFRNTEVVKERTYISNREMLSASINGFPGSLPISDNLQRHAKEIILYLQQTFVIEELKGTTTDFLKNIVQLISRSEITAGEFGLVVWVPQLTEQLKKQSAAREISARFESGSRHIGKLRDTIITEFTLIESRYITTVDCFIVFGYNQDHDLIQYWAKNKDKICQQGMIKGRIKSHNIDEKRGRARVTILNYVKVL